MLFFNAISKDSPFLLCMLDCPPPSPSPSHSTLLFPDFRSTRLGYGQLSSAFLYKTKRQEDSPQEVYIRILVDLLGNRIQGKAPGDVNSFVKKESLKALLLLSDSFTTISSYEILISICLQSLRSSTPEDFPLFQHALLGLCKVPNPPLSLFYLATDDCPFSSIIFSLS